MRDSQKLGGLDRNANIYAETLAGEASTSSVSTEVHLGTSMQETTPVEGKNRWSRRVGPHADLGSADGAALSLNRWGYRPVRLLTKRSGRSPATEQVVPALIPDHSSAAGDSGRTLWRPPLAKATHHHNHRGQEDVGAFCLAHAKRSNPGRLAATNPRAMVDPIFYLYRRCPNGQFSQEEL